MIYDLIACPLLTTTTSLLGKESCDARLAPTHARWGPGGAAAPPAAAAMPRTSSSGTSRGAGLGALPPQ